MCGALSHVKHLRRLLIYQERHMDGQSLDSLPAASDCKAISAVGWPRFAYRRLAYFLDNAQDDRALQMLRASGPLGSKLQPCHPADITSNQTRKRVSISLWELPGLPPTALRALNRVCHQLQHKAPGIRG